MWSLPLKGKLSPARLRSPTGIASEPEYSPRPPVVIALAGDEPTAPPHISFGGSIVALRVRTLDGLLSIAEEVPNGLVLLRADSFRSADDVCRWRSAHPSDWVTALVLSTHAGSVRATLAWLSQWPLPVLLDRPTGPTGSCIDGAVAPLLQCAADIRESCRMLPYFASRLLKVIPIVAAHLVAVYGSPCRPTSLKQLAAECHKSDRHVRRLLRALVFDRATFTSRQAGCFGRTKMS